MRVFELMTDGVQTVPPEMPAVEAWELMRRNRIQHLVVTKDSQVLGVLSEQDAGRLVECFLQMFTRDAGCVVSSLSTDAVSALLRDGGPGNVRQLANVIECLALAGGEPAVTVEDLPAEVRVQESVRMRPKSERRRTVADDLYKRLIEERDSFWSSVYTLFKDREITRGTLRELIRKGLEESRGNYRLLARLFNIDTKDYKRFLNFLRKHECQLPFMEFRQ